MFLKSYFKPIIVSCVVVTLLLIAHLGYRFFRQEESKNDYSIANLNLTRKENAAIQLPIKTKSLTISREAENFEQTKNQSQTIHQVREDSDDVEEKNDEYFNDLSTGKLIARNNTIETVEESDSTTISYQPTSESFTKFENFIPSVQENASIASEFNDNQIQDNYELESQQNDGTTHISSSNTNPIVSHENPGNSSEHFDLTKIDKTDVSTTSLTKTESVKENEQKVLGRVKAAIGAHEVTEEKIHFLNMHPDVLNDKALPNSEAIDLDSINVTKAEAFEDARMLDYSQSHPFENSCRFPVISHADPDLSKFVTHYREMDCPTKPGQTNIVSQYRNGEILIGRPHRYSYSTFECYYIEISGTLTPNKKLVNLIGNWTKLPLGQRIFIQRDQFVIKCYNDNKEIYHNVFAWVPEKPRLSPPSTNTPKKYSISLLVFESVSRNQFYRHMPLTLKFMKELEFQVLYGYTKVGDNSAINMLPILSGMVYDKVNNGFETLVENDAVFDFDARFEKDVQKIEDSIIARAKKAGCVTMWNDIISLSGYGLFHYSDFFSGFSQPIADYYYRPFYEYMFRNLEAKEGCNHGEPIIPKRLQLWDEFTTKYANQCHLSLTFLAGLTHASSNNLELYDVYLSDALGRLKTSGALDNTFLFILGDHGQRISFIQETHIGRIEERMPMMGIHVPKKFRNEFPDKYANLVANTNQLTSNFDIHETLENILDLTLGTPHEDKAKHGISLFEEIPLNRTCVDALIPENFCVCMEEIDEDRRIESEMESIIMPYLNAYLDSALGNLSCISNWTHSLNPIPKIYTISKSVKYGARELHTWDSLPEEEKQKITRDIFDVEFEGLISFEGAKTENGTLKARLQYNSSLKTLSMNALPLVKIDFCPGYFVLYAWPNSELRLIGAKLS